MNTTALHSFALALCCVPLVAAQTTDDTQLKQVIIFGRHSVRSALEPSSFLNTFSAQPFPEFSVPPGYLTTHGAALETILGSYYRLWLMQEGLLTGADSVDAPFVYLRANTLERTRASAHAFATGLLPLASVNVNYTQQGSDPLFDPVGAGVAQLDSQRAVASVAGRLGDNAQSLASAYASELALTRSVLFDYPLSQNPPPATPAGKIDVTTMTFDIAHGQSGAPVDLGGLLTAAIVTDPFVFEYADGMPASNVGWGHLTEGGISQITRLTTLVFDLEYRTPYLDQVRVPIWLLTWCAPWCKLPRAIRWLVRWELPPARLSCLLLRISISSALPACSILIGLCLVTNRIFAVQVALLFSNCASRGALVSSSSGHPTSRRP